MGVFVLLASGCGGSEPVRSKDFTPGAGPDVTELSLGRKPGAPWVFRPRNDVPDWDTSLPIDWSADPFEDRSWQHHLHSWRPMEYWLHEYRRDGEVAQLLAPIEIALDWHLFHVEEGRTSAFQWYDHSTGLRASRLAFLLDLILSDQLEASDADLARLMTLADMHAEKLIPNPPKDTDGRREDSGRGVRELQGRWPGLHWGRWEVGGRSSVAAQGPYGRLRELRCAGWRENTQQGTLADRGGASLRGRWVSCSLAVRPGVEWLAAGPRRE